MSDIEEPISHLRSIAKPQALILMNHEVFWDEADPLCPFRGDSGDEVLRYYLEVRQSDPGRSATEIMQHIWDEWGFGADNDPDNQLTAVKRYWRRLVTAVAFAQLAESGSLDDDLRDQALEIYENLPNQDKFDDAMKENFSRLIGALQQS